MVEGARQTLYHPSIGIDASRWVTSEKMNMDAGKRQELIEIQIEAAAALDAGQRLATTAAQRPVTGRERSRLCMEVLGSSIAKPAEFWAGACVVESGTGVAEYKALQLSVRHTAARMAVGDLEFVRESLVGQAQWASVLAVKLAAEASGEDRIEKSAPLYKLAMQAQRQAAQALATAAALNKLVDADAVTVS
jgi:hypothetical protein